MTNRPLILGLLLVIGSIAGAAKVNKNLPYMAEGEAGRSLILPGALTDFLNAEFPGFRVPAENEFNPEMLRYYNSRLVGIHPAVAWGDFNQDKKIDYALLIVTGEGSFGPQVELVVLNGESKKDRFTPQRLGEIYNFRDDYVSFSGGKLYKGRYKKNGWYINWDKKSKTYLVYKS